MKAGVRIAALALLVCVAYLGYRVVHHATEPVIPAVVMHDADA